MILTRPLAYLGGAAALFAAGYGLGTSHTSDRWQARVDAVQAERDRNAARVEALAEVLEAARAEREALAAELEEAANADPDAGRLAIGADSVQRLNRR